MVQGPRLECGFYASESSFLRFSLGVGVAFAVAVLTAYFEPGRKEVEPNLKFKIMGSSQCFGVWPKHRHCYVNLICLS